MLDLEALDQEHTRWIAMGGALAGVDLEIRHVGPKQQEKFRQKMIRDGILKKADGGVEIASGRQDDFFRAYAEHYVSNWRGQIKPEGAVYDPKIMGIVLGKYQIAFEQIGKALSEEADFFSQNGAASIA